MKTIIFCVFYDGKCLKLRKKEILSLCRKNGLKQAIARGNYRMNCVEYEPVTSDSIDKWALKSSTIHLEKTIDTIDYSSFEAVNS